MPPFHILLRSGSYGLSKCMHRFLVGYALAYNRRHHRHSHLWTVRGKPQPDGRHYQASGKSPGGGESSFTIYTS